MRPAAGRSSRGLNGTRLANSPTTEKPPTSGRREPVVVCAGALDDADDDDACTRGGGGGNSAGLFFPGRSHWPRIGRSACYRPTASERAESAEREQASRALIALLPLPVDSRIRTLFGWRLAVDVMHARHERAHTGRERANERARARTRGEGDERRVASPPSSPSSSSAASSYLALQLQPTNPFAMPI